MKIKVNGVKKLKFNKDAMMKIPQAHGLIMQSSTIENAPVDTSTLKNYGIEIEGINNGVKVYLDTEAIRANYPDERQRARKDGGNYGYYQEEGWTQHGIYHPGKHYFEKGYEISNITMENELLDAGLKQVVTTE